MFLLLIPFAFLGCVSGHGGVLWPPTWQAGVATPLWKLQGGQAFTDPKVRDPNTGREVDNVWIWLTDQAYTGGIGDEFRGIGPTTNINKKNPNMRPDDMCRFNCKSHRNPWAAPGQAPILGGGCGVFGGNPEGCPKGKDTRPPGSKCGQDEPIGRGIRGTSSFGTDARLFDFPQMITTEWDIGSIQDVVWYSGGRHRGGYTYRLCEMPEGGRTDITEECFAKNVLEFATNFTVMKEDGKTWAEGMQFEQTDVENGTYPEGSVWRPVGFATLQPQLRRDKVIVPSNLTPGDYVLGWRWDVATGNQVWVSCSSIKLVHGVPDRAAKDIEDYEELLYTDEEYAELEAAFENDKNEDYEELLYTDEEYAELEAAFEN